MVKQAKVSKEDLDAMMLSMVGNPIEDRLTPDNAAPTHITDFCTICKVKRRLDYYDSQYRKGVRAFDLYNCPDCKGTFSYNPSPEWLDFLESRKQKQ